MRKVAGTERLFGRWRVLNNGKGEEGQWASGSRWVVKMKFLGLKGCLWGELGGWGLGSENLMNTEHIFRAMEHT